MYHSYFVSINFCTEWKYKNAWQTVQIKDGLSKSCLRNLFTQSDLELPAQLFLFLDKVDSEFSWYFLLAFFKYTIFLVFSLMFVSFKVSLNTWNVFLAAKILNELNLEVTEIFAFQGFIYSSIYKRGLYFNKITAPSMTGLPLESLLLESKR